MLKGEHANMGLKTYEKEVTQNKHVNAETKQTKNQGFWVMASCMLEQVCVCISSACVHRLDHVYADPYLKKPKQRNRAEAKQDRKCKYNMLKRKKKKKKDIKKA